MSGGKKAIILVVALAFVALAFTGCLSSDTSGSGSDNTGTNDNNTNNSSGGGQYNEVGIVVHDGYISYGKDFLTPADGSKYVVYNVTITNNKDSELTLSILDFELETSAGTKYMPSFSAGTTMNTPQSLAAHKSYSFVLAYEIPIDTNGTRIVYDWITDEGHATVPI